MARGYSRAVFRYCNFMPTFLIADDSAQKTAFLKGFLSHAKWDGDILTATTTEEAVEIIKEHPDIGFAFVDYYIPSKCGPAVIDFLKRTNPKARIALVSSSDRKENQEEAKAAGAEACICTSYELDVVQKTVLDLLEEWKAIDS